MKKVLIFVTLILFTFLGACSLGNTTNLITTENPTTNFNETTYVSTSQTTDFFTTITNTTLPITTTNTTSPITTADETVLLDEIQEIYLYSTNDFHGGAYADLDSFSLIGEKILDAKSNNDHVIALANGDMLQGTAISNYYYGKPLIEAMNAADFNGFVIGNHEFDWGIEKIESYSDGNLANGEANYPFLAANIVYKDSLLPLDFTEPYIISEKNDVKVGIIGVIGNVIDSIAASRVEDFTFLDPVTTIEKYAKILRTEEMVDIVIVYIHDGSYINNDIAMLSGDQRVDAVFNGHYHQKESYVYEREGLDLVSAQVQSNSYSLLAEIKIEYNIITDQLVSIESKTISESYLPNSSNDIDELFNEYKTDEVYLNFVNQILAESEYEFDRYDLGPWGASVIRDYLNVDIAAVNYGGFRVNMEQGNITMGDLITIYPFDNVIKTSMMTGLQFQEFYLTNPRDVTFDDKITTDGYRVYIDGAAIDLDKYYTVAAVDYIFDKTEFDFLDGINITYTGKYMRDLLIEDLLNNQGVFNPYSGTSYQE